MDTTTDEDARAEAFGRSFVVVQHLSRLTDAALADWGITSRQWLLLAVLGRAFPGAEPSLTEAAAAYGSSRQNVKQIALGLEARGFLALVSDVDDARTTRIRLLPAVARFDEPAGRARGAALLELAFAGLDAGEIVELDHLLGRWLAGLASTVAGRSPASRGKDIAP